MKKPIKETLEPPFRKEFVNNLERKTRKFGRNVIEGSKYVPSILSGLGVFGISCITGFTDKALLPLYLPTGIRRCKEYLIKNPRLGANDANTGYMKTLENFGLLKENGVGEIIHLEHFEGSMFGYLSLTVSPVIFSQFILSKHDISLWEPLIISNTISGLYEFLRVSYINVKTKGGIKNE